jgi:hypothetical protein
MVQQAIFIVETQQEQTHDFATLDAFLSIAKASDHAVCGAHALDLLHTVSITLLVREIEAFGDDPVAAAAGGSEPPFGVGVTPAGRRKPEEPGTLEEPLGEVFKRWPPFS